MAVEQSKNSFILSKENMAVVFERSYFNKHGEININFMLEYLQDLYVYHGEKWCYARSPRFYKPIVDCLNYYGMPYNKNHRYSIAQHWDKIVFIERENDDSEDCLNLIFASVDEMFEFISFKNVTNVKKLFNYINNGVPDYKYEQDEEFIRTLKDEFTNIHTEEYHTDNYIDDDDECNIQDTFYFLSRFNNDMTNLYYERDVNLIKKICREQLVEDLIKPLVNFL